MENTKTLNSFILRETLYCFLHKSTQPQAGGGDGETVNTSSPFLLESDISSHLMQSLLNHNLLQSGTLPGGVPISGGQTGGNLQNNSGPPTLQIDYTLLYHCFDVLDVLGFITRKSDAKCNQRWLRWVGFGAQYGSLNPSNSNKIGFRGKYAHVIYQSEQPPVLNALKEVSYTSPSSNWRKNEKYQEKIFLEKFMQEFINRLWTNENHVIYKQEINELKQKFFYEQSVGAVSDKDKEHRDKLYKVAKKFMILLGMIQKYYKVVPAENQIESNDQINEEHQLVGYQLVFKHMQDLFPQAPILEHGQLIKFSGHSQTFNEQDYFKDLKNHTSHDIKFTKSPQSTQIQSFNTPLVAHNNTQSPAGFALLMGPHWSFTLQSLSCIIGRSPSSYISSSKCSMNLKAVWHVDLDLGHLRKVSRQHCLIIWNFEDMKWEIRCLSRRYPVRVGKREVRWGESGVGIQSGEIIGIASESFFFMLPKEGKEEQVSVQKCEEGKQQKNDAEMVEVKN